MEIKSSSLTAMAFVLASVGSLVSFAATAATSIKTSLKEYSPTSSFQEVSIKADSWYNLTMGYQGWTHHSSWGFMNLKKDKPVSITVDATAVKGFHPAISVWYRPQKRGMAPSIYANAHFYNQFKDIIEPNATFDDDKANPKAIGKLEMYLIANAYDRDGMGDTLKEAFDQSAINKVLDGVSGKVVLTFTPKVTGMYQFVVGGINPAADIDTTQADSGRYPVQVSVDFPD